ncbi:MAG: hypothetical protein P9L98_05140 [Candidatus Kaelpia imicola]|nr:hypothetical protein [Candidatus Kaelpia imicola]
MENKGQKKYSKNKYFAKVFKDWSLQDFIKKIILVLISEIFLVTQLCYGIEITTEPDQLPPFFGDATDFAFPLDETSLFPVSQTISGAPSQVGTLIFDAGDNQIVPVNVEEITDGTYQITLPFGSEEDPVFNNFLVSGYEVYENGWIHADSLALVEEGSSYITYRNLDMKPGESGDGESSGFIIWNAEFEVIDGTFGVIEEGELTQFSSYQTKILKKTMFNSYDPDGQRYFEGDRTDDGGLITSPEDFSGIFTDDFRESYFKYQRDLLRGHIDPSLFGEIEPIAFRINYDDQKDQYDFEANININIYSMLAYSGFVSFSSESNLNNITSTAIIINEEVDTGLDEEATAIIDEEGGAVLSDEIEYLNFGAGLKVEERWGMVNTFTTLLNKNLIDEDGNVKIRVKVGDGTEGVEFSVPFVYLLGDVPPPKEYSRPSYSVIDDKYDDLTYLIMQDIWDALRYDIIRKEQDMQELDDIIHLPGYLKDLAYWHFRYDETGDETGEVKKGYYLGDFGSVRFDENSSEVVFNLDFTEEEKEAWLGWVSPDLYFYDRDPSKLTAALNEYIGAALDLPEKPQGVIATIEQVREQALNGEYYTIILGERLDDVTTTLESFTVDELYENKEDLYFKNPFRQHALKYLLDNDLIDTLGNVAVSINIDQSSPQDVVEIVLPYQYFILFADPLRESLPLEWRDDGGSHDEACDVFYDILANVSGRLGARGRVDIDYESKSLIYTGNEIESIISTPEMELEIGSLVVILAERVTVDKMNDIEIIHKLPEDVELDMNAMFLDLANGMLDDHSVEEDGELVEVKGLNSLLYDLDVLIEEGDWSETAVVIDKISAISLDFKEKMEYIRVCDYYVDRLTYIHGGSRNAKILWCINISPNSDGIESDIYPFIETLQKFSQGNWAEGMEIYNNHAQEYDDSRHFITGLFGELDTEISSQMKKVAVRVGIARAATFVILSIASAKLGFLAGRFLGAWSKTLPFIQKIQASTSIGAQMAKGTWAGFKAVTRILGVYVDNATEAALMWQSLLPFMGKAGRMLGSLSPNLFGMALRYGVNASIVGTGAAMGYLKPGRNLWSFMNNPVGFLIPASERLGNLGDVFEFISVALDGFNFARTGRWPTRSPMLDFCRKYEIHVPLITQIQEKIEGFKTEVALQNVLNKFKTARATIHQANIVFSAGLFAGLDVTALEVESSSTSSSVESQSESDEEPTAQFVYFADLEKFPNEESFLDYIKGFKVRVSGEVRNFWDVLYEKNVDQSKTLTEAGFLKLKYELIGLTVEELQRFQELKGDEAEELISAGNMPFFTQFYRALSENLNNLTDRTDVSLAQALAKVYTVMHNTLSVGTGIPLNLTFPQLLAAYFVCEGYNVRKTDTGKIRSIIDKVFNVSTGEGKTYIEPAAAAALALMRKDGEKAFDTVLIAFSSNILCKRDFEGKTDNDRGVNIDMQEFYSALGLRVAHLEEPRDNTVKSFVDYKRNLLERLRGQHKPDIVYAPISNIIFHIAYKLADEDYSEFDNLDRVAVILDEVDATALEQAQSPFIISRGGAETYRVGTPEGDFFEAVGRYIRGLDLFGKFGLWESSPEVDIDALKQEIQESRDISDEDRENLIEELSAGNSPLQVYRDWKLKVSSELREQIPEILADNIADLNYSGLIEALGSAESIIQNYKDKYIIEFENGVPRVIIVSEFSHEAQPGKKWQNWIHQMIESYVEGVPVSTTSYTSGSVIMYEILAKMGYVVGLSGTVDVFQKVWQDLLNAAVMTFPEALNDLEQFRKTTPVYGYTNYDRSQQDMIGSLIEHAMHGESVVLATLKYEQKCDAVLTYFRDQGAQIEEEAIEETEGKIRYKVTLSTGDVLYVQKYGAREDLDPVLKGMIEQLAGEMGLITIGSPIFGRGIDIDTSQRISEDSTDNNAISKNELIQEVLENTLSGQAVVFASEKHEDALNEFLSYLALDDIEAESVEGLEGARKIRIEYEGKEVVLFSYGTKEGDLSPEVKAKIQAEIDQANEINGEGGRFIIFCSPNIGQEFNVGDSDQVLYEMKGEWGSIYRNLHVVADGLMALWLTQQIIGRAKRGGRPGTAAVFFSTDFVNDPIWQQYQKLFIAHPEWWETIESSVVRLSDSIGDARMNEFSFLDARIQEIQGIHVQSVLGTLMNVMEQYKPLYEFQVDFIRGLGERINGNLTQEQQQKIQEIQEIQESKNFTAEDKEDLIGQIHARNNPHQVFKEFRIFETLGGITVDNLKGWIQNDSLYCSEETKIQLIQTLENEDNLISPQLVYLRWRILDSPLLSINQKSNIEELYTLFANSARSIGNNNLPEIINQCLDDVGNGDLKAIMLKYLTPSDPNSQNSQRETATSRVVPTYKSMVLNNFGGEQAAVHYGIKSDFNDWLLEEAADIYEILVILDLVN